MGRLHVNIRTANTRVRIEQVALREKASGKPQPGNFLPEPLHTGAAAHPVPANVFPGGTQNAAGFQRQLRSLFRGKPGNGDNVNRVFSEAFRRSRLRALQNPLPVAEIRQHQNPLRQRGEFLPQNLRTGRRNGNDPVKFSVVHLIPGVIPSIFFVGAVVEPQYLPPGSNLVRHIVGGKPVLGVGNGNIITLRNGGKGRPQGQPQLNPHPVVKIGQEAPLVAQQSAPAANFRHGEPGIQRVEEGIQIGHLPANLIPQGIFRIHNQKIHVKFRLRHFVQQIHKGALNAADSQSVAHEQDAFFVLHGRGLLSGRVRAAESFGGRLTHILRPGTGGRTDGT